MDPEALKHLQETVAENNRLLHELVRAKRLARFVIAIKWLVVIGATLGTYYYLQPLIDQTFGLYRQIITSADQILSR